MLKKLARTVMLFTGLMVTSISSFATSTATSTVGFEGFIDLIISFKNMTKFGLFVIGATLLIWGIIQLLQQADFFQVAMKLLGSVLIVTLGFNFEKLMIAVGGTMIDPEAINKTTEIASSILTMIS